MQLWEAFTLQVFLMKRHNTPTHLSQGQEKKHFHDLSKTYAKDILKNDMQQVGEVLKTFPLYVVTLLKREKYFVPNSLVVSRGCPHHCDFCYKDAFYSEGKSFYTRKVDDALAEIDSLPGRHLYFLDDHLQVILTSHQNYLKVCAVWVEFSECLYCCSSTNGNLIEKAAEEDYEVYFQASRHFSR